MIEFTNLDYESATKFHFYKENFTNDTEKGRRREDRKRVSDGPILQPRARLIASNLSQFGFRNIFQFQIGFELWLTPICKRFGVCMKKCSKLKFKLYLLLILFPDAEPPNANATRIHLYSNLKYKYEIMTWTSRSSLNDWNIQAQTIEILKFEISIDKTKFTFWERVEHYAWNQYIIYSKRDKLVWTFYFCDNWFTENWCKMCKQNCK